MLSQIGNSNIKRDPIKFPDIRNLDSTLDGLYKQMNNIISESKSHSFTFYAAETSGGSATKKVTIEFNKFGIIKKLEII